MPLSVFLFKPYHPQKSAWSMACGTHYVTGADSNMQKTQFYFIKLASHFVSSQAIQWAHSDYTMPKAQAALYAGILKTRKSFRVYHDEILFWNSMKVRLIDRNNLLSVDNKNNNRTTYFGNYRRHLKRNIFFDFFFSKN